MARAITHCPNCGERVSPFAAGCALCGADLDAARAKRSSRPQVAVPRPRLPAADRDWVHVGVAFVVALAAPPIGLLLALYWTFRRYRAGQTWLAVAMAAAAAVALAVLFDPMLFWNHLLKL